MIGSIFFPTGGTRNKQTTLDWISAGDNPTVIVNIEILYENYEVAVGTHSAFRRERNANGILMFFGRKRGDKFSY